MRSEIKISWDMENVRAGLLVSATARFFPDEFLLDDLVIEVESIQVRDEDGNFFPGQAFPNILMKRYLRDKLLEEWYKNGPFAERILDGFAMLRA
jgi:hypothetical protein